MGRRKKSSGIQYKIDVMSPEEKAKLRVVTSEIAADIKPEVVKTPMPEVVAKPETAKRRAPRQLGFSKDEWMYSEDKEFYYFTQKYFKGPVFRKVIKLIKTYWTVKEQDDCYHIMIKGEK